MTAYSKTAERRNTDLKFHPRADIFPLMEGEEFAALVADIKANGLNEHIVICEGMILDGRNRYRACIAAGVDVLTVDFEALVKAHRLSNDPAAFVTSANIHRRHLTAEQKRDLIAKLLKADPSKSDRQIAETVKASPTFVGKVRAEGEATGDVSTVDTRTDKRGRKQPARKRRLSAKEKRRAKADAELARMRALPDEDPAPAGAAAIATPAAPKEYGQLVEDLLRATLNYVEGSEGLGHVPKGTTEQYKAWLGKSNATERFNAWWLAQTRGEDEEQDVEPGLREKLRAAEIKIVGLEAEVEELKQQNAELRRQRQKEAAPADDGLDIPDWLRRSAS
jgi:hypothetical protein